MTDMGKLFPGIPKGPTGIPEPVPPDRQFKGHPQLPINERLEAAKNFLADEDPNRCIGFREKHAEIDEYLKYIKGEKLQFDEKLFRDVRIMSETHHEWDKRVQQGWIDTDCGTKPLIQPRSNRLLTGSQTQQWQSEREAMGVEAQMRGEDPPFSVDRNAEHAGFIKALAVDSTQDPDTVDEGTNLMFVEGRAYEWAMREPAWIPYWMHPTEGLSKTPIKADDDEPWYRQELAEKRRRKGRTLDRPPRQELPEAIQSREYRINLLLAKGKDRTLEEDDDLHYLLSNHFPPELIRGWVQIQVERTQLELAQVELDSELRKLSALRQKIPAAPKPPVVWWYENRISSVLGNIREKLLYFKAISDTWYRWIEKAGGVQCVVESSDEAVQEATEALGVLIFPAEQEANPSQLSRVARARAIVSTAREARGLWNTTLSREDKNLLMRVMYASGVHRPELAGWVDNVERIFGEDFRLAMLDRFDTLPQATRDEINALRESCINAWKGYDDVQVLPPGADTRVDPAAATPGEFKTFYVAFSENPSSIQARERKRQARRENAKLELMRKAKQTTEAAARTTIDYTPQAERRGIQRAAIELGLNLLCTNEEQHRPDDKFRIVQLPPPHVDWSDRPEVPLTLPLDPTKRPVELEPFYFTKKVAAYRWEMEMKYHLGRTKAIEQRRGLLDPPANLSGPFSVASLEQYQEVTARAKNILTSVYSSMARANKISPRPLMAALIDRVDEGLRWRAGEPSIFYKEIVTPNGQRVEQSIELTNPGIDLLNEIAGPSWDESQRPFEEVDVRVPDWDMAKLTEFCNDIEDVREYIPLWEAYKPPKQSREDTIRLVQQPHDPYVKGKTGISLKSLLQLMNSKRVEAGGKNIHLWTEDEAKHNLDGMRLAQVIRYNDDQEGMEMVSQIPFDGHPENKYVTSLSAIPGAPGVKQNQLGHYEVRYDAEGTIGPCIVQPNKYEYLQRLSWQLGRLITRGLSTLADYRGSFEAELAEQKSGYEITYRDFMQNLNEAEVSYLRSTVFKGVKPEDPPESLQDLALELHEIAPDIAQRSAMEFQGNDPRNMTAKQAATLLQIQVLEENNNSWESRFPENEHVWDFAAPRLVPIERELEIAGEKLKVTQGPRKYFNMRRFPVGCQTEVTQLAIRSSGPVVRTKADVKPPEEQEPDQLPGEIYRGADGPPYFPFGETPYQEAYQSFRMEQDLADVPEFKTKPATESEKTQKPTKPVAAIFRPALPELPPDFNPISITPAEKRLRDIEERQKQPGAPDPKILENYYKQWEIKAMEARQVYEQKRKNQEEVRAAIEKEADKKWDELSREEILDVCKQLGIDPSDPKPPPKGGVRRSNRKRPAANQPSGEPSSQKTKRAPSESPMMSPSPGAFPEDDSE
ncbi:hypothetical protein HYALB_00011261 [Hymenoscyphus albidus]|uniref:Uncharacterized protein n=1 Tax=Hymenoscyphus albidus TaxID=595503 RepID=A0A9N9LVD9_9HELO|nr:hypothetical protein HYALB_00011261 [Hymenoscyphus albidus]